MKIAIFSDSYLPFLNGVSISILMLHDELRRRGHEVWIYAPRFRAHRDEDPYVRRFPSIYTPFERNYPVALPLSLALWREWREQKFDLVHTHTPFLLGLVALRAARKTGTPIVSTYHTLYEQYLHYVPKPVPKTPVRAFLRRYLRWYYERIDQIMTPSHVAESLLRRYGVRKPITVIRNPVLPFPEVSKTEARRWLQVPEKTFMLLYVGRLAKEKNVSLLLTSLPPVIREFPGVHLWVVGDGPERPKLEALCRQVGIETHVHFTGAVPRDQVSYYMLAADLFTFPSLTESQGLVLDEAQATGLPCVVANGGGAPEAVLHGVTGLVAEPTPGAFTEAILTLLQDESLLVEFSQKGFAKRETLSVPAVVDRIMAVYEIALNTKSYQLSAVSHERE